MDLTGTLHAVCHKNGGDRGNTVCFYYLHYQPTEEGGTEYTSAFLNCDVDVKTESAFAAADRGTEVRGTFTGEFIGDGAYGTFRVDDFQVAPQPAA